MLKCFSASPAEEAFDRRPFVFGHRLLRHPSLELKNLARAIPALPRPNVYFSSGLLAPSDDFDQAHKQHPNGLTIEATIEQIRTSNSYIMVRSPEVDFSFRELWQDLVADTREMMRERGLKDRVHNATLYLFIASPNSVTPFHVDRYSTFLLQFRGRKDVYVFPQFDERIVQAEEMEGFMAYAPGVRPGWRPEIEAYGERFDFGPGQALHIPFAAGHLVRNGADDVSISLSIIFHTEESAVWRRALVFNHYVRPWFRIAGLAPHPVARQAWRDAVKSGACRSASLLARAAKRVTPSAVTRGGSASAS